MLRSQLGARAPRRANDHRHTDLAAEHVANLGGVVHDHVLRDENEVDRHDLDHRTQPEHRGADAGKVYRTTDEITSWRERDPIAHYVDIIREHDLLDEEELERMRKQVADEVSEAIREAAAAPTPDPGELYENVYGDEQWREQFARTNTAAPFGERQGTRSWQT